MVVYGLDAVGRGHVKWLFAGQGNWGTAYYASKSGGRVTYWWSVLFNGIERQNPMQLKRLISIGERGVNG